MKRLFSHSTFLIFFFFSLLLSIVVKGEDRITWQNPKLHGNTLASTKFVDASTGWAVGSFGTIMKTTDGGKTWENQNSGTTVNLSSVSFIDKNTGWAGGSNTLIKTTDGGKTWNLLTSSSATIINTICFLNSNIGFIAGGQIIQKTVDGGKTFTNVTIPAVSFFYSILKMHFVSSKTGWAVGTKGALFNTTDGGNTWTNQFFLEERFNTVFFVDSLHGSIFGDSGFWATTTDGGKKWNKVPITNSQNSTFYNDIVDAYFYTKKSGVIITRDNSDDITVYRTSDGGAYWKGLDVGFSRNMSSISFPDTIHGCIVGHGGFIARTEDSGNSWSTISSGEIPPLISICFTDKSNGFVIGEQSTFMKTSDGGEKWEHSKVPNTGYINGVYALNEDTILIANGMRDTTVFISTNGGKTWKGQLNAKFSYSIDFANKSQGACVGWYGEIHHTYNLGKDWTKVESGTESDLYSIDLLYGDTIGYAVGDKGICLKTSSCGRSWSTLSTGSTSRLFSVSFADPITGWCCGQGGTILNTKDGGKTWKQQTTNTYNSLNCIKFFNKKKGYAVGHYGTILKTTDGGETWTEVPTVTANNLFSLCFVDENTIYVAGWYGSILKIEDREGMTVEEINAPEERFLVYPNPANNSLFISSKYASNEEISIEMFNFSGQTLLRRDFKGNNTSVIDVSGMEKGYYIIRIQSVYGIETKKVLIK